ncbi:MAG: carbon-nitrogen hydrolase family protein [Planctomycetes bacterium]|nr:carbon-nitrogen hydrolase family protein [Planctomycetota bacterium]
MRVAAVQMKFARTIAGNLSKIAAALERARRRKADAVLFPECAVTGYSYDFASLRPEEVRDALAVIRDLAKQARTNILVGSPVFSGRKLYNALVVIDRSGRPVHCYAKCQLTDLDRKVFRPGDAVSLFELDGVACSAIVCHERRYPELVRLAAMAGARILFHPNAGLDPLAVSKAKRRGADGIDVRAFENAIYYVFANSVGPQGRGLWSAGDTKIVAPDRSRLALADNERESVIVADLDLSKATGKYARESLRHPRFLSRHWERMLRELRSRVRDSVRRFDLE